jgi:hypothetical protein
MTMLHKRICDEGCVSDGVSNIGRLPTYLCDYKTVSTHLYTSSLLSPHPNVTILPLYTSQNPR